MKTPTSAFARRLRRNQFLRLERPHQLCLRAERGTLWVTIDNQPDDIVLTPGERIVLDGNIHVLITPLGAHAAFSASPLHKPRSMMERVQRFFARDVSALVHA